MKALDSQSLGAPVYDAASDSVYFIMDEQLLRGKGFDPESAEVVGDADEIIAWLYSYAAVLDDETVVVADRHTAWAYLDADEKTAKLAIASDSNELMNSAYYAYLEKIRMWMRKSAMTLPIRAKSASRSLRSRPNTTST